MAPETDIAVNCCSASFIVRSSPYLPQKSADMDAIGIGNWLQLETLSLYVLYSQTSNRHIERTVCGS